MPSPQGPELGHARGASRAKASSPFDMAQKRTQPHLDLQLRYAGSYTKDLVQQTDSRENLKAIRYPKGELGKAIPALADQIGADLVIMGSAARRLLEGLPHRKCRGDDSERHASLGDGRQAPRLHLSSARSVTRGCTLQTSANESDLWTPIARQPKKC